MQLTTFLLTTSLFTPPAPSEEYAQTLDEIAQLNQGINAGEQLRPALFDALASLPLHTPTLAADPEGQAVRVRAQLNLARSYLSAEDHESASGVMDEVIRSTVGETLPVEEFGPSLTALHAEREAALAGQGRASIAVDCKVDCRVFVNERLREGVTEGLYLGVYRVWIEVDDAVGPAKPLVVAVRLSAPDEVATVDYDPFPKIRLTPAPRPAPAPKRVMPREAELALLVIGIGAASVGGLLVGMKEDRTEGRTIAGVSLAAVGGAMAVLGGVTLGVDEVRIGRARGRVAMAAWTMNF